MDNLLLAAIKLVVDQYPEIIPLLSTKALVEIKGRDKREPHLKQKLSFEKRLAKLMKRVFTRQAESLRMQIANTYPAVPIKAAPKFDPNIDWADDEQNELVTLLLEAGNDGISMVGDKFGDAFDPALVNIEAAKWAKKYSFELIKGLDETTIQSVREAVSAFIEVPGTTIGDVMDLIMTPDMTDARAMRIAVTEITRAYGESTQLAGEAMAAQFPDLTFEKTWYTNNDDIVCPVCGDLDGVTVPLEDEFTDGVLNPPAHVNCRCWSDTNSSMAKG